MRFHNDTFIFPKTSLCKTLYKTQWQVIHIFRYNAANNNCRSHNLSL